MGVGRPVVAAFTLTAGEYGEGMRALMRRQITMWVGPVLGGTTFFYGISSGEIVATLAGLVVLCVSNIAIYVAPVVRFGQNKRLGVPQEHTFTEDGVSVRAGKERGHLPWGFYSRAIETRNVYVFLRNTKSGNFVPKKGFASAEAEAQFRALVAQHLRTSWQARA